MQAATQGIDVRTRALVMVLVACIALHCQRATLTSAESTGAHASGSSVHGAGPGEAAGEDEDSADEYGDYYEDDEEEEARARARYLDPVVVGNHHYTESDYDIQNKSNYWVLGMPRVPLNHMEAALTFDAAGADASAAHSGTEFAAKLCRIAKDEHSKQSKLVFGASSLKDSSIMVPYEIDQGGNSVVVPTNAAASISYLGDRMDAWVAVVGKEEAGRIVRWVIGKLNHVVGFVAKVKAMKEKGHRFISLRFLCKRATREVPSEWHQDRLKGQGIQGQFVAFTWINLRDDDCGRLQFHQEGRTDIRGIMREDSLPPKDHMGRKASHAKSMVVSILSKDASDTSKNRWRHAKVLQKIEGLATQYALPRTVANDDAWNNEPFAGEWCYKQYARAVAAKAAPEGLMWWQFFNDHYVVHRNTPGKGWWETLDVGIGPSPPPAGQPRATGAKETDPEVPHPQGQNPAAGIKQETGIMMGFFA